MHKVKYTKMKTLQEHLLIQMKITIQIKGKENR
jgi:hypothetical protein